MKLQTIYQPYRQIYQFNIRRFAPILKKVKTEDSELTIVEQWLKVQGFSVDRKDPRKD